MKALIIAASCLLCSSPVLAQKVGDTVWVSEKQAKLMIHRDVVGTVDYGNLLKIERVNGEWFWVNHAGSKGWINRGDVTQRGGFLDQLMRFSVMHDAIMKKYLNALDCATRWKMSEEKVEAAEYNYLRGVVSGFEGEYEKAIANYIEAIRVFPTYGDVYDSRAWLFATCPDSRYRNGKRAVEDARRACELTDWKNDDFIVTLGAAHAEVGDFADAIQWTKRAMKMNPGGGFAGRRQKLLELYRTQKPYRDELSH